MVSILIIKLVRHGESEANIGNHVPHIDGDFSVNLTQAGYEQAREASIKISPDFLSNALIYCSPYWRTRQTLSEILASLEIKPKIYEDPRIREVERGYIDEASQHELRKVHGWFYYRHKGGESPADVYDRTSSFLESMMRNVERKGSDKILIVSHGMTIRCFIMRFLHLTVEQFESMKNPTNGAVITVGPVDKIENPEFRNEKWAVSGLTLRG